MATIFTTTEETEERLGKVAGGIQWLNHQIFILMIGFASVIGFAAITGFVVYSSIQNGSAGFADSMCHTRLNEAMAATGIMNKKDPAVFTYAYNATLKHGRITMAALSVAIVFAGLVPVARVGAQSYSLHWLSITAVSFEILVAIASFYYRTFQEQDVEIKSVVITVIVGVAYMSGPPIILHGIVTHMRRLYNNEIDKGINYLFSMIKQMFK